MLEVIAFGSLMVGVLSLAWGIAVHIRNDQATRHELMQLRKFVEGYIKGRTR